MRRLGGIALLVVAASASADSLWFDPPNPTSRTPVTAHVMVDLSCPVQSVTVARTSGGFAITVRSVETPICLTTPGPIQHVTADLGVLAPGVYDVVVGHNDLLVAVANAKLVVQDATPGLVVSPNVGLTGDAVTVKGTNAAMFCLRPDCTPPVVKFGDATAVITRQVDQDTLVVNAPPHDTGVVDVTVTNSGQTWHATASFDYFDPGGPFDPAFFEPVLFPVMITGPGAFGSQWSTEAVMRNDNDYPFPVYSFFDPCTTVLLPVCQALPAHFTSIVQWTAPSGYLMPLPRQAAPAVSFGLLVKDLSHQAEAFGTEIPVVREKDFFDRPFTILNVPTDPRYRVALRLYRIDGFDKMHVRILSLQADAHDIPLVDEWVGLLTVTAGHRAQTITDLLGRYPQLAGKGPLRIELDSDSARPAAWGFVSVTNNNTQHVTVISPQ